LYAEVSFEIKKDLAATEFNRILGEKYPNMSLPSAFPPSGLNLGPIWRSCVAQIAMPNAGTWIVLLTTPNLVIIYIIGASVAEIKRQSQDLVQNAPKLLESKVKEYSVRIYSRGIGPFDTPILKGEEVGYIGPFFSALLDKWITKVLSAAVTVLGTLWYASVSAQSWGPPAAGVTTSTSTSIIVGPAIAFVAVIVSVFFESIHTAWRSKSWKWSEVNE
jgi:hypothetical protein